MPLLWTAPLRNILRASAGRRSAWKIVADSNPAAEYEETRDKARALVRALELAQRADDHTLNLIAVAALGIAALFFLTVAQVSRTMVRVRQAFFLAGAVLVLVGALGFVLVELLA